MPSKSNVFLLLDFTYLYESLSLNIVHKLLSVITPRIVKITQKIESTMHMFDFLKTNILIFLVYYANGFQHHYYFQRKSKSYMYPERKK